MSINEGSLISEHLQALRNELKEFRQETKESLQIIIGHLNYVERTAAGADDDNFIVEMKIDKVDQGVDRIEKKIGINDH